MRAVRAFVAALTSNDLAEFEAIAENHDVSNERWAEARALISKTSCIEVHSFRAAIERQTERGAMVTLDIDGRRTLVGVTGATVAAPSWVLEIICHSRDCTVRWADIREGVIAMAILAAPPAERECVLEMAQADDEGAVARELADRTSTLRGKPPEIKRQKDEVLRFARQVARRHGDLAAESHCAQIASQVHSDDSRELPLAFESLELARASGDTDAMVDALLATGEAKWHAGQWSGALDDLRTAASMLDQIRDGRFSLHALGQLSRKETEIGQLRSALRHGDQMLKGSERLGWTFGASAAARCVAKVHYLLQDFETNRQHNVVAWRKGVMARDLRSQAYALHNIATADLELGRFDRSIEEFRRSAALARGLPEEDQSTIYSSLVEALQRTGRFREANEAMSVSLEYAEKSGNAIVMGRAQAIRGELALAERRPAEALAAGMKALDPGATQSRLTGWGTWHAQATVGRALRQLGRIDEAETMLRAAVAEIESQRSQIEGTARHYFEGKTDPYAELAEILAVRQRGREALDISERIRVRTLTAILDQGKVDLSASMTEDEKLREAELNRKLADLNRAVAAKPAANEEKALIAARDAARAELQQFRDVLEITHPRLRQRRSSVEVPLRIDPALQQTLLVEYLVREGGIVILAVRRGPNGVPLVKARFVRVSRRRLTDLAAGFVGLIENRALGYRDPARQLYELLLRPVEPELRRAGRLCIIPDDVLWRLPFQALIDGHGRYLQQQLPLFYAPSVRMLSLTAPPSSIDARGELLAFGNPALPPSMAAEAVAFQRGLSVGALPDAEREVESIRRLYGASDAKALVGSAASESTFKREAPRYRVLHIATHGLFDEGAPMFSTLLLASSPQDHEDGFLEAREIADLSLRSDLAILSACDTARGRTGAGEGLIGMSWALQAAGCPTTVVSQWKVASAPTARLMIELHRALLTGSPKPDALRRAAMRLKADRRTAHPFYWAAFVVVGQP